jgi:hypothetical protein
MFNFKVCIWGVELNTVRATLAVSGLVPRVDFIFYMTSFGRGLISHFAWLFRLQNFMECGFEFI